MKSASPVTDERVGIAVDPLRSCRACAHSHTRSQGRRLDAGGRPGRRAPTAGSTPSTPRAPGRSSPRDRRAPRPDDPPPPAAPQPLRVAPRRGPATRRAPTRPGRGRAPDRPGRPPAGVEAVRATRQRGRRIAVPRRRSTPWWPGQACWRPTHRPPRRAGMPTRCTHRCGPTPRRCRRPAPVAGRPPEDRWRCAGRRWSSRARVVPPGRCTRACAVAEVTVDRFLSSRPSWRPRRGPDVGSSSR